MPCGLGMACGLGTPAAGDGLRPVVAPRGGTVVALRAVGGQRPVNVPRGGTGDACGWECPAGWVKTGGEVTT